MNQTIHHLLTGQLASWETARNNYAALSGVRVKELNVNGIPYKVQFNPARIVSSGAKVDAKSILERKCFLCPANLPPVQKGIPFGGHYNILVNPFPIFPRHLTVPELAHTPQRIATRFTDMLELAEALTDFGFDRPLYTFAREGFAPFRDEYKAACVNLGRHVTFDLPGGGTGSGQRLWGPVPGKPGPDGRNISSKKYLFDELTKNNVKNFILCPLVSGAVRVYD